MFLLVGGICSLVAALLHIGCIIYGASWYRFFGAGERMVNLSNKGSALPTIITLHIAIILTVFGIFTIYSADYMISPLPMTSQALILIMYIYLIRGAFGFLFILKPLGRTKSFWGWSSCVCLIVGIIHYFGILNFHPYV
jgi:hypothetical protein